MEKVTRRRVVVWGGVGLMAAALLVIALWPRPVKVDIAPVTRGPLQTTLDHEGKTRVRERYEVSAPATGRVLRIELQAGDPVVADSTVLATLVPSAPVPLDTRSRAEAEASLAAARAALTQARAERERAAARHDYAATEWRRMSELVTRGSIAQERADAAEADAREAAQALAAAEASVDAARHEVARARAALLEPERVEAGAIALSLRSPVDGVVLERLRESSGVVAAGTPLLVVGDATDLEIVSDYLSEDAVRIQPGMRVEIERWGGEDPLTGVVRRVEPYGFLKVSALGVEERRVNVVSDFTEPSARRAALGDGYRVETHVVTWSGDDVLQVPIGALFRHGEQWAVFALRGGRARRVAVELGHRSDRAAEVVAGLAEDERVVMHPADNVSDGKRVAERGE
jgi:HlyD family secretion protein